MNEIVVYVSENDSKKAERSALLLALWRENQTVCLFNSCCANPKQLNKLLDAKWNVVPSRVRFEKSIETFDFEIDEIKQDFIVVNMQNIKQNEQYIKELVQKLKHIGSFYTVFLAGDSYWPFWGCLIPYINHLRSI